MTEYDEFTSWLADMRDAGLILLAFCLPGALLLLALALI